MAATSRGVPALVASSASSDRHPSDDEDVLDDAYERFQHTSPEFRGWLSNHGPMAAATLVRLGAAELVPGWVRHYARRLEPAPVGRWPIAEQEWREPLGDPSRLGDWLSFFSRALTAEPWQDLLHRWWPRLLPGAVAAATHGIVRTGQAVRALRVRATAPRVAELAHALGYWAARWQRIPTPERPSGRLSVGDAFSALPAVAVPGGFRTRLAAVEGSASFHDLLRRVDDRQSVSAVPHALTTLTDTTVSFYRSWAYGQPVMLLHAASAPRAAALVLPSIPHDQWERTYATAWVLAATVATAYRPVEPCRDGGPGPEEAGAVLTPESVVGKALHRQDEHVLEFVEVALESHRRGNQLALPAAHRAITLIQRPR